MRRVKKQGLKGLEASTIGLTLVGYIAAGFLLGQWLDSRYGTAFWMPALVLIGTGAGFRDIFRLVVQMGKQNRNDREEQQTDIVNRAQQAKQSSRPEGAVNAPGHVVEEDRPRPRIFTVPPPPRPSFDRADGQEEQTAGKVAPLVDDELEEDETTLIEKLMAGDDVEAGPAKTDKESKAE